MTPQTIGEAPEKEDRLRIPEGVEEITPSWLTMALAVRYPGTEVQRVDAGRQIHGSGTKVRLLLEYNEAGHEHHLPPTMWIKAGYEPHSDMVRDSYVSGRTSIGTWDAPGWSTRPTCTSGGPTRTRDIRCCCWRICWPATPASAWPTDPLGVATVERALAMMARYHAIWWGAPELASLARSEAPS